MARKPWDQLPNETDTEYWRFTFYRNYGISRTLERAYDAFLETKITKREGKPSVPPSNWRQACAAHRWKERAEAWDVHKIALNSGRAVAQMVNYVSRILADATASLESQKGSMTSEAAAAHLAVLEKVGAYIKPESFGPLIAGLADQEAEDLPAEPLSERPDSVDQGSAEDQLSLEQTSPDMPGADDSPSQSPGPFRAYFR